MCSVFCPLGILLCDCGMIILCGAKHGTNIFSFNIYSHPVRYIHNCCHSLAVIEKNEARVPKQLARGLTAGWAVWLIVATPNFYMTRKTQWGHVGCGSTE